MALWINIKHGQNFWIENISLSFSIYVKIVNVCFQFFLQSFLADEPIDELGSLTEQKWRNFSTREGVEKMAKAENPNSKYSHLSLT